jgi:Asp-tRNA(Asn)/Glu-tRNA(Gln) amidotransferase A subunit family amidase
MTDRRTFLSICTAAGLAPAMSAALWRDAVATGRSPLRPSALQTEKLTTAQLAAAAAVAGLSFTEAEREMMLDSLNGALQSFGRLRGVPLPNSVAPALSFNPVLPGWKAPPPAKAAKLPRRSVTRPATPADLAFAGVADLAELVRTRQVTATELIRLALDRLKQYGPTLECVVTLTEERAIRQAAEADREIAAGKYRGPLHGIPWGAKDLLAVPGYPTTWGSPVFKDQVLPETATVVERLDAAGAILVAKLTLGELAMGDVWHGGMTRNPWSTQQGSSGSSAGSASATSAGLVPFAIGTETLGSIVSPSTRCGVTGLRPTFGRVSRHGAMALSWSMDKIGPICRSAEDCALVFSAIHGPDGKDGTVHDVPFGWDPSRPLSALRVGYLKAAFEAERPTRSLDDAALEALRGLGVAPVPIELPGDLPIAAMRIILSAEGAAAFDDLTRTNQDDRMVRQVAGAWPNVFRSSRFIPAVEYIQANRLRTLLMQQLDALFRQVDVFLTPSFGGNVLLATNLTGHPALVVPSGFTAEGAPVSVSFIGSLFGEADLCLIGQRWQDATGWHRKRPPEFAA